MDFVPDEDFVDKFLVRLPITLLVTGPAVLQVQMVQVGTAGLKAHGTLFAVFAGR